VTIRVTREASDAVTALRGGGLVALPTETVYGLAGDARDAATVTRIFQVKGRPADHPVIVHLADATQLDDWARDLPTWAHRLVDACWPGPLTIIARRADGVLDAVTGGQPTVGLRVPAHPLTREVLTRFGGGVAAPSANRYGQVSPTSAAHVVAELGDRLDPARDLVLDGGACPVGVESTIVGAWDDSLRLLRTGAVTADQLREITGLAVLTDPGTVRTPGSTASHYAPAASVVPVDLASLTSVAASVAASVAGPFGLIAQADVPPPSPRHVRLASPRDASEYAHCLYAALRAADDQGLPTVVAVLPPDTGIGRAVRDRLTRAAAGRTP
jgi:L-threonylcarbamoyladenylate synthase